MKWFISATFIILSPLALVLLWLTQNVNLLVIEWENKSNVETKRKINLNYCSRSASSPDHLKGTGRRESKKAVWTYAFLYHIPTPQPKGCKISNSVCVWFLVAMQPRVRGRDWKHQNLPAVELMPLFSSAELLGLKCLNCKTVGRNYAYLYYI